MLAEVLLAVAGTVTGFGSGWLAARRRPSPAICPCGHAISFHDRNGQCHAQIRRWSLIVGNEFAACTCQHYAGPELISSITMQPVVPRPVTDNDGS